MSTRPNAVGLSDEWKRRLNEIKEKAKVAEKGSTYFLEVSSLPVVSLFIVAGDKISTVTNENETHLHFAGQPDTYPSIQDPEIAIESIGYHQYLLNNSENDCMDLTAFKSKFELLCEDIETASKESQGIKCHEDGSRQNTHITNVIYLHICDVLNIMMNKKKGHKTQLVITSRLLPHITEELSNELDAIYLKDENRVFFYTNIDYIYYYYAYLSNHSILPIRSEISLTNDVFIYSRFFMNNDHYVRHQEVKCMKSIKMVLICSLK